MRSSRGRLAAVVLGVAAVVATAAGCGAQTVDIDLPAQVDAPLPDQTTEQLRSAVTAAMGATGSSGAIVGVWAPWSGSWVSGLGAPHPDGGGGVSTDMVFRAGEVTRAMTCDVLFQVAGDGTVSLDDPVSTWVAGFPDLTDVTLRQLCDGTSGLGSFEASLRGQWFTNPARHWNPSELAAYGLGQPRANAPGSAFHDSDTGYVLLGLALERATGQTMSELLADRVADRLDLDATALPGWASGPPSETMPVLEGHWSIPDAAGAWNCADPADLTALSASMGASDAGAVTDIDDLGRYAQALATGALVPADSGRFSAPVPVADQPTWFTAAGGAYQAGTLIGQFGFIPGYLTAAFADPETGLTVAVVLNNSGANRSIGAWLAWELAAIASKAPAASGQTAPEAGLPWTAQQFHDQIAANAICAPPAG